jgi:hypothetical protein
VNSSENNQWHQKRAFLREERAGFASIYERNVQKLLDENKQKTLNETALTIFNSQYYARPSPIIIKYFGFFSIETTC